MKKILLTLLTVFFVVMSTTTFAAVNETGDTNLTITSTPPTVSTVELNDGSAGDELMDLTAGLETSLNCWGAVTDPDGLNDIQAVAAEIYGPSSNPGAVDNDDIHYTNASCGYNITTGAYNCTFLTVEFYAENGTWTCLVNVSDYAGNTNISNDTAAINQLLAIDIPDATEVNFGSIGVGGASVEQSVTVENEGNVPIDIETDVYRDNNGTADTNAMNCSTGLIPAININASLTSGSSYSTMIAATILSLDANLAEATGNDQVPTTDIVYLVLEVPGSGVAGICDGTIFFGATIFA